METRDEVVRLVRWGFTALMLVAAIGLIIVAFSVVYITGILIGWNTFGGMGFLMFLFIVVPIIAAIIFLIAIARLLRP